MKYKVFVDGQHGTTGLEINKKLKNHDQVEFTNIDYSDRRDAKIRKELLNNSDIVFLCLPDEAAKESISMITNPNVRVIDTSVAHRVSSGWVYGVPELNKGQREKIKNAKRVSVAGCHATGFILSITPLISGGIISDEYPVSFHSITGYSGGGKNMIKDYESDGAGSKYEAPHPYALTLNHKHLPEMKKYSGLKYNPIFMPIVCNYYKGMAISIPLFRRILLKDYNLADITEYLAEYYAKEQFISVKSFTDNLGCNYFDLTTCNDSNKLDIFVFGNEDSILLMSRFDNLGKGASGAAIQNMNIMLGLDEAMGLE